MRETLAMVAAAGVLASGCGLVGGAVVEEEDVERNLDVVEDVRDRVSDIEQQDRMPSPGDG